MLPREDSIAALRRIGVTLVPSVPGMPEGLAPTEIHLCCRGYCAENDCRASMASTWCDTETAPWQVC